MNVASHLLENTDWGLYVGLSENGGAVKSALAALLSSSSPEMTKAAYWRLENQVVAQGEVFSVAVPTTAVLVAALSDPLPRHVVIAVLDLLYQVLSGYSTEGTPSSDDFVAECREAARGGLYSILREAVRGESEAAWDVLDQLHLGGRFDNLRSMSSSAR